VDWLPWLLENAASVVVGLIIAAGNFVAAAASGAVIAVVVAWLERRWHRQEVRAAEKRARLEERFEPVRWYAAGLMEFTLGAVTRMNVWENQKPAEGWRPLAARMLSELEETWKSAEELKPRPGPWVMLVDMPAKGGLLGLELAALGCKWRCEECLKAGDVVGEEEKVRWVRDAGENMEFMLDRMKQLVAEVEG
jgi:hypothetical protein